MAEVVHPIEPQRQIGWKFGTDANGTPVREETVLVGYDADWSPVFERRVVPQ